MVKLLQKLRQTTFWSLVIAFAALSGSALGQDLAMSEGLAKGISAFQESEKTKPLSKALDELEERFNVHLNYEVEMVNEKFVNANEKVADFKDLDEALSKLLSPISLAFERIEENYYVIYPAKSGSASRYTRRAKKSVDESSAPASELNRASKASSSSLILQDAIIRGKVTSMEDNEPLPGVNVVVKGTATGTTTDIDGNYSVRIDDMNSTIIFSYIGYTTEEVNIAGRSIIDLAMAPDIRELSEIVVVGYGQQERQTITGAIATVPIEQISSLPVSNLSESLAGRIPGLSVSGGSQRPGEPASLSIRQSHSFSKDGGNNTPLIVIDDMIQVDPNSGLSSLTTFNNLDPSEIESITVLKDASAGIYGARASQGAIVVKTKRGSIGKPRFNYSGQYALNDAVSHSKTMSAYEYGIWHNRFLKATERDNDGSNLFSTDELEEMKGLNYDWLDKAWSAASQYKHSLSMSGGTEKATYFAGGTYYTQGANLGNQDYNKWNFRTGVDVKITNNLKLSGSLSANSGSVVKSFTKALSGINDSSFGSKARNGTDRADYGYLLHMPKYIPWQTTVGEDDYWVSPFPRTDRDLGSANANNKITGWNYFALLNNGSKVVDEDFSHNVNFSLQYSLPFIKGLSVKGTFSRSQSSFNGEQIALPFTLARYTRYNNEGEHLASAADEADWKIEENVRSSRVYYTNNVSTNTQSNFFVNYDRSFGRHEISAMGSVERAESSWSERRVAYEDTDADYLGTNKTAGSLSDNSLAARGEAGMLSYLGRLSYNYSSKYMLQFLFRSDASTKFAPENYWGFFPSLQVGWTISEENWFQSSLPWVDFLKLRYSVGKTGKDNIQAWRWAQFYGVTVDKGFQFGGNGGELGGSLTPEVTPNRKVTWDATVKHNAGIDFSVLDDRLGVGFDYYFDRTTDMLTDMAGAVGIPISVGGGYAEENYAAIDSWGSELSVNWNDKVGQDFSYNIGVNFGIDNNKVKKYPEGALKHPAANQMRIGRSRIFPAWGFETWKETSGGDGILRTDEDIQNYWNYLEANATAAGTEVSFDDITSIDEMKKGMLAYKDIGGDFNSETGTQAGPDGRIDEELDYVKLADKDRSVGFTTNIRMKYKSISFATQISTSWGGLRLIDLVKQGTSSNHNMWAHESFWSDMYDPDDNVNGKYPNIGYYDDQMIGSPSDFWQINSLRAFVRSMSIGYDLPTRLTSKAGIERATIGITGHNLWDLYNPYPDHYRNMYDTSYEGYPTLRTWAVNLNVTF